jgi:thioredoxin 1
MSDSGATHFTTDEFRKALKEEKRPVFVDFYADWCGPCLVAAPIIDKLAGEFKKEMLIAKLNVDENPGVAQEFGVMSIPTVLVFQPGAKEPKILATQVGFSGEESYRELIKKALN